MTKLLDRAFEEARKRPPEEQDALGSILLEEFADEARWAKKFAEQRAVLEAMITPGDSEIEAGDVSPLESLGRPQ